MNTSLAPTPWRTCRVLANKRRLRLLQLVVASPGQTVTAIAAAADLSMSQTSQYLRALNARGLLKVTRRGAKVLYRAEADSSLPAASVLLPPLKRMLAAEPESLDRVFRLLTAFTHPRRVAIVQALQDRALPAAELRRKLRISGPAIERHVRKLRDRGLVISEQKGYRLAKPPGALARALLRIALDPVA